MISILKKTSWWIVIPMMLVLMSVFLFILVESGIFNPYPDHAKKGMDAARKSGMQQIHNQLGKYYSEKGYFPASLLELGIEFKTIKDPKTGEDYLYSYYPVENPTSYHLGAILEIKDDKDLNDDADFNSKVAGYVNGFDGKDPVFDIYVGN